MENVVLKSTLNKLMLTFFVSWVSFLINAETKTELDRLLLKDGTEIFGSIVKKTINGIEIKKDKDITKVEYEKIQSYFFGENKSEWELIFDSILTGNYAKAITQLSELATNEKKTTLKEDIKFYTAICYYYQKNYAKFFELIESLVKELPQTYFLYHILNFIVDLIDMIEIKELSAKLSELISVVANSLSKQKSEIALLDGFTKLYAGISKERSGNYKEANDTYISVVSEYSLSSVIGTAAQIFVVRGLIKDNKLNESVKKLEELKDRLTKDNSMFLTKNVWLLLADTYKKLSEQDKEGREKYLKKALYAYLNIYLIYTPTITELPEVHARSIYYSYEILDKLSKTAKTDAQKNEYTNKAANLKSELQTKYKGTVWAEKLN